MNNKGIEQDDLTLKEFECLLDQVGIQSVFNQANHFINGLFFNGIVKTLAQSSFQVGLSRKQKRITELESALKSALDMCGHFDRLDYDDAFENIRNILDKKEPTV
jgi:hypothetical protein